MEAKRKTTMRKTIIEITESSTSFERKKLELQKWNKKSLEHFDCPVLDRSGYERLAGKKQVKGASINHGK